MTRIIIAALVLMAILLPLGEGAFAGTERYFGDVPFDVEKLK